MRAKFIRLALVLSLSGSALAGGPRFVTGTSTAAYPGNIMSFYTTSPLYFTDPADLTPAVPHAQADAMVAAAAAVWNVPTSILSLTQGGSLAEHVSSTNAYFTGTGILFPADVSPSNYLAKPIAILYDTDGSITDLLLGQGASDPEGCRHNGVTESVDGIGQDGTLQHAVIVLNGRCIGTLPQSLLQLQYQLARAFGRVLGLSWSQTNDNVFTGSPTPTAAQMSFWPLMHPLDVICGPYTYQCMINPLSLRADDLSTLALLYPVTTANQVSGKTLSIDAGTFVAASALFPTTQGMELVNITIQLELGSTSFIQPWQSVSGVTGLLGQQNGGNPVSGPESPEDNVGHLNPDQVGFFLIGRIPIPTTAYTIFTAEPINPLYIGDYSLGPYQREPELPSGPVFSLANISHPGYAVDWSFVMPGAASTCNPGNDGAPNAPVASDPTGWWHGQLCGPGHSSWGSASIKAGHSFTLESTALDEFGATTTRKAQTVLGVWNAADSPSALPTVAAAPFAMNSLVPGMTQLAVPAATADANLTFVIADQFAQGRPDFFYQARLLYADTITPASLDQAGGPITITGSGFRPGNRVLINGVAATVQSWTSTQIIATAPTFTAAGSPSTAVSVEVTDPSTQGSTTINSALTYTDVQPIRTATLTPTTQFVAAGATATYTLTLQATQDTQPAPNIPITWTASPTLTLQSPPTATNTTGTATLTLQTTNTPASAQQLSACLWTTICTTWTLIGIDPAQWQIAATNGANQTVPASTQLTPVTLQITDPAGHTLQGATVTLYQTVTAWEGPCPPQGRCPSAPVLTKSTTTATTDTNGQITVAPLQLPNLPQTVNLAAATGTQSFLTLSLTKTP